MWENEELLSELVKGNVRSSEDAFASRFAGGSHSRASENSFARVRQITLPPRRERQGIKLEKKRYLC